VASHALLADDHSLRLVGGPKDSKNIHYHADGNLNTSIYPPKKLKYELVNIIRFLKKERKKGEKQALSIS
jgi:hypothetical protein